MAAGLAHKEAAVVDSSFVSPLLLGSRSIYGLELTNSLSQVPLKWYKTCYFRVLRSLFLMPPLVEASSSLLVLWIFS